MRLLTSQVKVCTLHATDITVQNLPFPAALVILVSDNDSEILVDNTQQCCDSLASP